MTLRTEAGDSVMGRCAGEVARADRLAGREIALDDLAEDGARALVELLQLGKRRSAIGWPRGLSELMRRGCGVVAVQSLGRTLRDRQTRRLLCGLKGGGRSHRVRRIPATNHDAERANAPLQTQSRRASPGHHRPGRVDARGRLVPDQVRQHACALHGEPGGAAAALAEGPGPRLGDGRVRHAAARHHASARAARRPRATRRAARRRSSA